MTLVGHVEVNDRAERNAAALSALADGAWALAHHRHGCRCQRLVIV
jgi:hypothetical protein